MIRNFGIVLFVITIVSLSVKVEGNTMPPTQTSTETPTQTQTPEKHLPCSKTSPLFRIAGQNFEKAVKDMVDTRLRNKEINYAQEWYKLENITAEVLRTMKNCSGHQLNENESLDTYISLIKFSLSNASDLIRGGQITKCVNKQKANITKCLGANRTIEQRNIHQELRKNSLLTASEATCLVTKNHKKCVNAILEEDQDCKPIASYVDNLFELAMSRECSKFTTPAPATDNKKSGSERITAAWATFAVLMLEWSNLIEFINN